MFGLIVALLVVVADQVSKALIYGYLNENSSHIAVTGFFNLVTAWNRGVSFSMFDDLGDYGVYIWSSFSLVVSAMLIYWLCQEKNRLIQVALGFVVGGAIGNVIDRIRLGAVFDFLDVHVGIHHWPAFNVADSFICIGAVLIIVGGLFCGPKNQKGNNLKEEEK